MIQLRTVPAVLWLSCAALPLIARDATLMRRQLVPNSTETYRVQKRMNIVVELPSGMGEQESDLTSDSTLEVRIRSVDPVKGVAKVDTTSTVTKLDSIGMMGTGAGAPLPKPQALSGKLDKFGQLTLDATKASQGMGSLLIAAATDLSPFVLVFPEKPISVGDTWDIDIPEGTLTPQKGQKLTAKLDGSGIEIGRPVWKVSFAGKLQLGGSFMLPKQGPGGAPNPLAGKKAQISGEIDLAGHGSIDQKTGQFVKLNLKTKAKQSISVSEVGLTLDTTSVGNIDIDLVSSS